MDQDLPNSLFQSFFAGDKKKSDPPTLSKKLLLSPLLSGFSMGLSSLLEKVDSGKLELGKKIFYYLLSGLSYAI